MVAWRPAWVIFVPGQVGHVEHVHRLLAEGHDMGRGDVEVELAERRREVVEQARPVEARHLDHGLAVRQGVVDGHLGRHVEGLGALLRRALAVHEVGDLHLALERPLDRFGDPLGPAQLVLVPVEGARQDDGVERHAVRGGEDLRVDDVAARGRAGAR